MFIYLAIPSRSLGFRVLAAASGGDAVVAPRQAATARGVSGITAAVARRAFGLLRVMPHLRLGDRQSQQHAVFESRDA
jgi:hypothetical protein